MAKQAKTLRLIEEARDILSAHHPMTVRQVYYLGAEKVAETLGISRSTSSAPAMQLEEIYLNQ